MKFNSRIEGAEKKNWKRKTGKSCTILAINQRLSLAAGKGERTMAPENGEDQ